MILKEVSILNICRIYPRKITTEALIRFCREIYGAS